jgi:hypothetical protein
MDSAFLGSFQKPGARVFSSSSAICLSFLSMSKMPPQRFFALPKVFELVGGDHDGKLKIAD